MESYHNLLKEIMEHGRKKADRTGDGTTSLHGASFKHDLSKGFPMLTTKQVGIKSIVTELLWFIGGYTSIEELHKHKVHIWDADAIRYFRNRFTARDSKHKRWIQQSLFKKTDEEILSMFREKSKDMSKPFMINETNAEDLYKQYATHLGEVYGKFWQPQIKEIVDDLESIAKGIISGDTDSYKSCLRRLCMSSWNNDTNKNIKNLKSALPPCHTGFQVLPHIDIGDEVVVTLDFVVAQRSADVFLGVPYNMPSYSFLNELFCYLLNLRYGKSITFKSGFVKINFGDAHIYNSHKDAVEEILSREPKELPKINISLKNELINGFGSASIYDLLLVLTKAHFGYGDFNKLEFSLEGYEPHKSIKAPLLVGE